MEWGVDVMLEVEAQGGAREGRLGGGLRTSLALCMHVGTLCGLGKTQAGTWFLAR